MRRSKPVDPNGDRRGHIKDIVSIRQRPAAVEDRAVPGHWEGDLLSGPNNSYIATLVERHTRYVMLAKVAGKDTRTVVTALIKQAKKLPKELYKSLTWDLGAGTGERNLRIIAALRWRPKSTYIFAICKARGSAGRTRTPMAC
jgi:IS30 family transposase